MIAKSGMASIFKANDLKTNRMVALKVPFMRFESDPGFFSRFKREEEIGKALKSMLGEIRSELRRIEGAGTKPGEAKT